MWNSHLKIIFFIEKESTTFKIIDIDFLTKKQLKWYIFIFFGKNEGKMGVLN